MTESKQAVAPVDEDELRRRLARDSKRSAILGFIAGGVVIGGLAATFTATIRTRAHLEQQVQVNTGLSTDLKQANSKVTENKEQAENVKDVLGVTIENLQQSKDPAVASSATAAVNKAFAVNPGAAKMLTRVYIHTRVASQHARAAAIADALRKAGYLVPSIDVQPYPKGAYATTQVHYYTKNALSLTDAEGIQKAVEATGIPVLTLQAFPKDQPPLHSYGVWLSATLQ